MKLVFNKKVVNNRKAIEVSFDKKVLIFSLDDNELTNDNIIEMLTLIAKEISAGNFDYQKDVVGINKDDLNEIKDLYEFIFNLFKDFIVRYIEESKTFEESLNQQDIIYRNKINNSLE